MRWKLTGLSFTVFLPKYNHNTTIVIFLFMNNVHMWKHGFTLTTGMSTLHVTLIKNVYLYRTHTSLTLEYFSINLCTSHPPPKKRIREYLKYLPVQEQQQNQSRQVGSRNIGLFLEGDEDQDHNQRGQDVVTLSTQTGKPQIHDWFPPNTTGFFHPASSFFLSIFKLRCD